MHLLTKERYLKSKTRNIPTTDLEMDAEVVVPGQTKGYVRLARRYATNSLLFRDRAAIRHAYKFVMADGKGWYLRLGTKLIEW